MVKEIDHVSRDIMTLLNEIEYPVCVREIEVYLGESKEIVLMSLGWLIREGFVDIEYFHGEQLFKLKDTSAIVLKNLS